MEQSIPLSEKLYLLGIHPERGSIVSSASHAMDYVIFGALLLELFQNKKVRFENKRIIVIDTKSENEVHRFMLEKMARIKSPLKISRWISKFYYSLKYIRGGVQKGLVQKRVIKMQPKHFLFFKWKSPAIVNKQVAYKLVDGVRGQIFNGTSEEEELILLSFIKPAGLLRRLFPERHKRRMASKKLKTMMVDNPVPKAVADAISAAQAVAASVATTSAVTAATS